MYEVEVYNTENTGLINRTFDLNGSSTVSSHFCGSWCDHWNTTYYPYTVYTYPQTIYKYQIKCPKCKTSNWLELDQMKACTRCESMLKAVKAKADFEIEIND